MGNIYTMSYFGIIEPKIKNIHLYNYFATKKKKKKQESKKKKFDNTPPGHIDNPHI